MFKRGLASLLILLAAACAAAGRQIALHTSKVPAHANKLPVRRVVLYKNGVGYFEHSAEVRGSQKLVIDFSTFQLNDVLNSLTAVDLDGGHISGMKFNSVAPLAERLRTLHFPLGERTSRRQFLEALRGTRVEVRSGSSAGAGKLLSVETECRVSHPGGESRKVLVLSLLTDHGDLRSFELLPGTSVHVADRELRDKAEQYLKLIGSANATDVRRMVIADHGKGTRTLMVSYISEVPVWKSTYRILLPARPDEKPLIQGWAIVDNTLGQDWKNVRLSLVAGTPQSFVENISVPYYVRRPVVAMPHSLMLTPETHEEALMNAPAPAPVASVGVVGGVPGGMPGGSAGGVLGGILSSSAPPPPPAMLYAPQIVRSGNLHVQGRVIGDMFEYDLKQPVTLARNQSALVPFFQGRLKARKVTLWNEHNAIALRALWLTNTSGETLDAGSFDVMEGGTFAGEGLLAAIRPGERRLLSYAADPAVRVRMHGDSFREPICRVHIADGLMVITREERSAETYMISNSDAQPRDVIVEQPVGKGWELSGGVQPVETTASFYRFKVHVDARQTATLKVAATRPELTRIELSKVSNDQVALFERQKRLTPELAAAFRKVLDQKATVADLTSQLRAHQSDARSISNDQERIRSNMKALKGSPEEKRLLQRYVRELNAQEDRLAVLRSQIAELDGKLQAATLRLNHTLRHMTLDLSL